MTSITQTVSTYTSGISQQPDQLKNPGQVSDATNVVPDIAQGLIKRPGSGYIKTLSSTADSTYFHYYRDDVEQYIGKVTRSSGAVKVWTLKDIPGVTHPSGHHTTSLQGEAVKAGDEVFVTSMNSEITSYLTHAGTEDLQFSTINDYTYINNRTKTVEMSDSTAPDRLDHNCAYIELKKTAYARQYAFNLFTRNDAFTPVQTVTHLKHMKAYPVSNASTTKDSFEQDIVAARHTAGTGTVTIPTHNFYKWDGSVWDSTILTGSNAQPARNHSPNIAEQPVHTRHWRNSGDTANYSWNNDGTCPDVSTEIHRADDVGIKIFDKNHHELTGTTANNPYDYTGVTAWESGASYVQGQRVFVTINNKDTPYRAKTAHSNQTTSPQSDATNWELIRRHRPKNLVWRFTVKGNSNPVTGAPSNPSSVDYTCSYEYDVELLHGGEGFQNGDYLTFTHAARGFTQQTMTGDPPTNLNVLYMVIVNKTSLAYVKGDLLPGRPAPTSFDADTVVNAQTILGDMQAECARITNGADEYYNNDSNKQITSTIIGNGLYLTRPIGSLDSDGNSPNSFNIETPDSDLCNVFGEEINDVSRLPTQCAHGYIVKVLNSDIDEDDYYLKFQGDNGRHGPGSWVECPKPKIKDEYKKSTMPLQLIRNANDSTDGYSFTIQQVDYVKRGVGDDVTNESASFVGSTINKVVFWRNRIGFLSGTNIILSQPGDENIVTPNFWAKTALTLSPEDVIDLSASSTYPANLMDGIETPAGLLLFSQNQQFLMTAEAEVLNAETAKIDPISSYNYNIVNPPVSLGTTTGFLDNAGKYTRLFEMINVQRSREPDILEQSITVPKLLPKNIDLLAASRENTFILAAVAGESDIYGYRYFNSGEKRVQSAWFKWKLRKPIAYMAIIDDALYVIYKTDYNLVKFDLKEADDTADLDKGHAIHLDTYKEVAASAFSYSTATGKTTFTLPTGFDSGVDIAVIDDTPNDSNYRNFGRYEVASVTGTTATLNGDWATNNHDLYIGYNYDMEVKFPTIYVTKATGQAIVADVNASLIIHRIKLALGDSGVYETTITRDGKEDYTELIESTYQDLYKAGTSPWLEERIHTLPTYERNTNLTFYLKSSHPSPATLYSMSWEGDYTNKYYKRA